MLTEKILRESDEYKQWIGDAKVALIHNVYYDSKDIGYPVYIVITSKDDKYTITRFFEVGEKIQVRVDYFNESVEKIFILLLSNYSSGLK